MATRYNIGELIVTSTLQADQLKKGAAESKLSLESLGKQATATALGFIGANSITAAMRTVSGALGNTVKDFAAFEKSMAEVSTLVDTSVVDMKTLRDGVVDLSSKYGDKPEGLAKALYQTISAGIDAKDAIKFLDVATKAAIGGVTDTTTAVDGLTSMLNAYGLGADQAQRASDILFTTVKLGKTTLGELSPVIGQVAPIANAAGVSMEEMASAMATLTLSGLKTSEAGTALRGLLSSLIKPSDEAKKAANLLGIEWGVQALKAKGLSGVMDDVTNATGGSSEVIGLLVPELRGMNATLQLSGSGAEKFSQAMRDMGNSAGATDEAAKKMQDTFSFQWQKITQQFKLMSEELLNNLAPAVRTTATAFESLNERTSVKFLAQQRILKDTAELMKSVREEASKATLTDADRAKLAKVATELLQRENAVLEKGGFTLRDVNGELKTQNEFLVALGGSHKALQGEIKKTTAEEEKAAQEKAAADEKEKQAAQDRAKRKVAALLLSKEEQEQSKKAAEEEQKRMEESAKLRESAIDSIHRFNQAETAGTIERLEAIVDDEKRTNQERLEAAKDLYESKKTLATSERDYLLEKNDRVYLDEVSKLYATKQATVENLNSISEKYESTNKLIEENFGQAITKNVNAIVEISAKLEASTFQRLGKEISDNWAKWFNELKSGSSSAWSSLVSDVSGGVQSIADVFGGLPDDVAPYLNDLTTAIVGAISGNPIQTAVGALSLVARALIDNKKAAQEYAESALKASREQKITSLNAKLAADNFLRAAGKQDITLMTPNELATLFTETGVAIGEKITATISPSLAQYLPKPELFAEEFARIAAGTATDADIATILEQFPAELRDSARRLIINPIIGGSAFAGFRQQAVGIQTQLTTPAEIPTATQLAYGAASTWASYKAQAQGMLNRNEITDGQYIQLLKVGAKNPKYAGDIGALEKAEIEAMAYPETFVPLTGISAPTAPTAPTVTGAGIYPSGGTGVTGGGEIRAPQTPSYSVVVMSLYNTRIDTLDNELAAGLITPDYYSAQILYIADQIWASAASGPTAYERSELYAKAAGLKTKATNAVSQSVSGGPVGARPSVSAFGGAPVRLDLLPGFIASQGSSGNAFLSAISTLVGGATTSGNTLLPENMDLNVNVNLVGDASNINDGVATTIGNIIGEAIQIEMHSRGTV